MTALRFFLLQGAGSANEIAVHYRADMFARSLSPASVARHLATLRSLTKYARMLGIIGWRLETPSGKVERKRDTRGPSVATVQAMLSCAGRQPSPTAERDIAIVRLAFDLALRIGELVKLDVTDVERGNAGLWIHGKGRRTKELVTLPSASRAALAAWLAVRGNASGPLLQSFSSVNHLGRLTTRGIYRIIRDLGAEAGEHVRPHGLRHTSITLAIEAAAARGLSIDVVRNFSRHRHIGTLLLYRDQIESKQGLLADWVSGQLQRTS